MSQTASNLKGVVPPSGSGNVSYWRVEGSLLELGAMRPVGYFTWNARSFAERWARRAGLDRRRGHARPHPSRKASDATWLDGKTRAARERLADGGSSRCSVGQASRALRRDSASGAALGA